MDPHTRAETGPPAPSASVACIGVDLAWSRRNPSGLALIELAQGRARLRAASSGPRSDDEVLRLVGAWAADRPCLVAVDAPLVVPNAAGARPADRLATALFGRFGAGAYPANRAQLLALPPGPEGPDVRPETIARRLERELGIRTTAAPPRPGGRQAIEVYPHPAAVVLFGLDRALPYKARPQRSLADRRAALAALRAHLLGLAAPRAPAWPPLDCAAALPGPPPEPSRRALKAWEDALDAVLCAYVAACYAHAGTRACAVLGDDRAGHIVVPLTPAFRARLAPPPVHLPALRFDG